MEVIHKIQKISLYSLGLLLIMVNVCFSGTIIIPKNTVISHSKTYNNVTLDMTNGSFIVTNNASLTLNNCIVNGNLSKNNPVLFKIEKGNLSLDSNRFNIKAIGIAPHPGTQSMHYVIQLAMAGLNMNANSFAIDQEFTAGFLITEVALPTTGIKITNNKFERFHGVIYLITTDNALISNNTLIKNSYGNIVVIGSNSKVISNVVYFAGNNRLGNSIDVIDSNNVLVSKNLILTPTCHGIYVYNSKDIVVDQNRVHGGITYGMNILSYPETAADRNYMSHLVKHHRFNNMSSSNITVSNNFFSQNRFGVAASDTDGLNVSNNMFIQRFEDNDSRIFWTNNNILLKNVTNLVWSNNSYKEAFTQEEGGNNSNSNQIIPFPQAGGVSL